MDLITTLAASPTASPTHSPSFLVSHSHVNFSPIQTLGPVKDSTVSFMQQVLNVGGTLQMPGMPQNTIPTEPIPSSFSPLNEVPEVPVPSQSIDIPNFQPKDAGVYPQMGPQSLLPHDLFGHQDFSSLSSLNTFLTSMKRRTVPEQISMKRRTVPEQISIQMEKQREIVSNYKDNTQRSELLIALTDFLKSSRCPYFNRSGEFTPEFLSRAVAFLEIENYPTKKNAKKTICQRFLNIQKECKVLFYVQNFDIFLNWNADIPETKQQCKKLVKAACYCLLGFNGLHNTSEVIQLKKLIGVHYISMDIQPGASSSGDQLIERAKEFFSKDPFTPIMIAHQQKLLKKIDDLQPGPIKRDRDHEVNVMPNEKISRSEQHSRHVSSDYFTGYPFHGDSSRGHFSDNHPVPISSHDDHYPDYHYPGGYPGDHYRDVSSCDDHSRSRDVSSRDVSSRDDRSRDVSSRDDRSRDVSSRGDHSRDRSRDYRYPDYRYPDVSSRGDHSRDHSRDDCYPDYHYPGDRSRDVSSHDDRSRGYRSYDPQKKDPSSW